MMPLTSSPLVGRARELSILRDAWDESRAGHPRIVVVRGEAGIGKSRLVRAFLAEVPSIGSELPIVIARGPSVDVGDIGVPFAPMRRLLHELLREVGKEAVLTAARTPGVTANLAALMPELPGAGNGGDHIAEAVERVVESLSTDRQLLLVLEDLQWADAATLALLRSLTLTAGARHLLIVLSCRSEAIDTGHPLRTLLADLERNRAVITLPLPRLTAEQTAELAAACAPALGADAIAAIVARADGVPFFAEELAERHDEVLPLTLRDMVLTRFDALDPAAQRIISAAAIGGRAIDESELCIVLDEDPASVRQALRAAMSAGIVLAQADELTFRHALMREFAAAELLPAERTDLHRSFGRVEQHMIDTGAPGHASSASVAEHWLAAGELELAFRATADARDDALRGRAAPAAVRLGERLLGLWPEVHDAARIAGVSFAELSYQVADSWRMLNEVRRAEQRLRQSASALAQAPPRERARQSRLLALILEAKGRTRQSTVEAQRGIDLITHLPGADSDPLLAELLATLSAYTEDPLAAVALSERATSVAEASGDSGAMNRAAYAVFWASSRTDDDERGLDAVRRMRIHARTPDDHLVAGVNESDILLRLGLFDDAVRVCEEGLAIAVDVGIEHGGSAALLTLNRAEALFARGDSDLAEQHVRGLLPRLAATPQFRSPALRHLLLMLSWSGRDDELQGWRDDAASTRGFLEPDALDELGWSVVEAEIALNRSERVPDARSAVTLVDTALTAAAAIPVAGASERAALRLALPTAARAWSAAHRRGLRVAAGAPLRAALERETALLDDSAVHRSIRSLVAAELAPSSRTWLGAVQLLEQGCAPQRQVDYARWRLIECTLAEGDRDGGAVLHSASLPLIRTPAVAEWMRALAARSEGHERARDSTLPELTPREGQVLELVAQGLTNRQIGERLFISPKTASVHVSAILAKIGAANRTEAATMYHSAVAEPPG